MKELEKKRQELLNLFYEWEKWFCAKRKNVAICFNYDGEKYFLGYSIFQYGLYIENDEEIDPYDINRSGSVRMKLDKASTSLLSAAAKSLHKLKDMVEKMGEVELETIEKAINSIKDVPKLGG